MDKLSHLIRQYASTTEVKLPADATPRLQRMPGIKAVVFDVYGTLFSSSAGDISLVSKVSRDSLLRSVLENSGIQLDSSAANIDTHRRFLDTIKRHQQRRQVEGIEFPEVEIRAVWEDFLSSLVADGCIHDSELPPIESMAVEFECRINPVQKMPGLESCLESIVNSGRVMGIISNAQFYTPLLFSGLLGSNLHELGFSEDISVWSYRMLEGKPSQTLYLQAAQKLRETQAIEPDEVLYIGNDIRNDIWPAQATGFRTALFAGDSLSLRRRTDDPQCNKVVPDIELIQLMQLVDCLD